MRNPNSPNNKRKKMRKRRKEEAEITRNMMQLTVVEI